MRWRQWPASLRPGQPSARCRPASDGRSSRLPVDGLERLAAAVDLAFTGLGRDPDHRPFRGHLTLARGKGVRGLRVPALAGPMDWPVESVSLVRSHLGSGGARYEDVAVVKLGPVLG